MLRRTYYWHWRTNESENPQFGSCRQEDCITSRVKIDQGSHHYSKTLKIEQVISTFKNLPSQSSKTYHKT